MAKATAMLTSAAVPDRCASTTAPMVVVALMPTACGKLLRKFLSNSSRIFADNFS